MAREAIAMQRKLSPDDDLSLAIFLHRLGDSLGSQGKFAEAEVRQREALAIQRKLLGDENPEEYWTVKNLAWVLAEQGKLTESLTEEREALNLARKSNNGESLDVALSLTGVANTLQRQNKLVEAETTYREALAMRRKLLGNEHPDVVESLKHLAVVLKKQGKLTESATIYRAAADQGDAWSQINLARMYARGQGVPKDEDEATKWYRMGAGKRRKDAQSGDAAALNGCAWLLATCEIAEIRDGSNAVKFAETAVSATSRKDPMILDTLAAAYAETSQFKKAVSVQKEAMALLKSEKDEKYYEPRLKLYESNLPYRETDQE
jgi:tetratricopeptide (TPR) repeat protein